MRFNITASPRNGIIQGIERTTGLGLGTISGNAAPDYYLDYFTQEVNNWLNYATHIIQRVSSEWTYDDANHSDFPIEEYATVDSQQDHGLDSDIKTIRRVEMRDATADAGEGWYDLDFQYEADRQEDRFAEEDGTPTHYWLSGRSIIWNVPADIAKVDTYRLTYDRHADEFTISDTIKEPGFEKTFHPILVYGPSLTWATGRNPNVAVLCEKKLFGMSRDMPGLIKMLKQHYFKQANQFIPTIGRKAPSGGSWR